MIEVAQLKQYVEQLQTFEREKEEISQHIKDILQDAKSNGYDITALKHILKLLKQDKRKLAEQESILETYKEALGIVL